MTSNASYSPAQGSTDSDVERDRKPIGRLSVVTTLYRSASHLNEFYMRVMAAAETIAQEVELILVNDGSPDDSVALAIRLHERDPRVIVVDLSRNFGHHRAMMFGLSHARGEFVFLLDCDLEEPPEVLTRFYDQMQVQDCDVVYGVQRRRRGSWFERLSGELFYSLTERVCDVTLPRNLVTARLMTARYVRHLLRHEEREIVIAGLWQMTGFNQLPLEIEKTRGHHSTTYSTTRRFGVFLDFVLSYSGRIPTILITIGITVFLLSIGLMVAAVVRHLVFNEALAGWTSLIASIWLFSGLQLLFLGIVGFYAARTFIESKRRPYAIVRELYDVRADTRCND